MAGSTTAGWRQWGLAGERMRDKLLAQGTLVDSMVVTGEGHGWAKESNNILFGQKVLDLWTSIGPNSPAAKK